MTTTASKISTGKSALLLGATGAVGKKLLTELLNGDEWTRVGEYGRRVTDVSSFTQSQASETSSKPTKLEQKVIDFERLDEAGLKAGRWDVVFVTLGTTRAQAGSAAQFEKIDREYVVRACEAAKTDDPAHEQRVVYLSSCKELAPLQSVGANSTSHFLYPRSKGLTEIALSRLGYSDTIVFRPSFLKGAERPDKRIAESLLGVVTGVMSYVTPNAEIEIPLLTKAMAKAGTLGSSNIPADVGATKVEAGVSSFTLLANQAAALLGRK